MWDIGTIGCLVEARIPAAFYGLHASEQPNGVSHYQSQRHGDQYGERSLDDVHGGELNRW